MSLVEPDPVVKPREKAKLVYRHGFYHCQRALYSFPKYYPAGTVVKVDRVEANYDQDHNRFQGYTYYVSIPGTWRSSIVDGFMLHPITEAPKVSPTSASPTPLPPKENYISPLTGEIK